jgi:hypothetical protein
VLARAAARLAGRSPDEHAKVELGNVLVFEDPMWPYHDFMMQAELAYTTMASATRALQGPGTVQRPPNFSPRLLVIRAGNQERRFAEASARAADAAKKLSINPDASD